jgi:hypothetical protein
MTPLDESMIHMDIVSDDYDYDKRVISFSNSYRLEIRTDDYPDSPRDWDNLGTMHYWHRDYILGDERVDIHYYDSLEELVSTLRDDHGDLIWLPLYLMDHSGITMSTSSHHFQMVDSHGWDWGCCGIITATYEDIKQAYMVDEITEEILEKATQCLISEVETFDQYITGDVYMVSVLDDNDNYLDGLGGIYGSKNAEVEGIEMARYYWENFLSGRPVQGVLSLEA